MHLQGHKRKCNDDNNYSNYIPKLTGLPPNLAKIASSSGVVDYSDDFALTDLRGRSDESKYGSVTEEYEDLRAQRMQFMSIVSAFRQQNVAFRTHGSTNTQSDLSTIQNQKNPIRRDDILSDDVIDLETDTMTGATSHVKVLPEQTVEADNNISSCSNDFACGPLNSSPASEDKKQETVIIIDSDEEDASHSIENKYGTSSDLGASERRLLLTNQIQKHISRATKLAQEVNSLQLVSPYKAIGRTNAMATTLNWQPSVQFEKVVLQKADEKQRFQDVVNENSIEIRSQILSADTHNTARKRPDVNGNVRSQRRDAEAHNNVLSVVPYSELNENDASVQENTFLRSFNEDDKVLPQSDGLEELWKDMALAIECSKGGASDGQEDVQQEDDCNHSYMLQDDFGLVCRICGVIQKSIDTIFDYQWTKVSRSTRTYVHESRNCKDLDEAIRFSGVKGSEDELIAAEVSIHPRHLKQMKPHQLEGFNFLVKNLVTDKPGGCILAHAPGSGKTFMLISFIQSFLAKYPSKRPLVVLPKGILPIWKKEFKRWQVEDLPIYDFYSVKADNRSQQVDVLKLWQENKSILFLGYKQFSNIISDKENSKVSAACREMLLKIPGLLILDEGHTPRNEDTYTLDSLAKVQTPRKVVLSGTLFQNNVREVFNILNLVRPKFLKMEHSRFIVKRVLSKVQISAGKKLSKLENAFYDLVEDTLQNDENFNRKVTVIRDLRELTNDVLHYYKGDFLEELPGLVDFTILLNLSSKQKLTVQSLDKFEKFKRTSVGSAVYIHPSLFDTAEKSTGDKHSVSKDDNAKIDSLLEFINFRDGVKTKFFLNILSLAESVGEKLLAFSQYLLPLRFLERLLVKTKGWQTNKEIFMITGDSQVEERERSMEQFNNSLDAKVFFGSIKACGEGISLVGASRVVILDVHLNPSVTRQAIGRAFRPGQLKKVYTYRLVAADSPEAEDHRTSFRKELISKMWFEWSDYCGLQDFQLDEVDLANCEDLFLESRHIGEDIKAVYRR